MRTCPASYMHFADPSDRQAVSEEMSEQDTSAFIIQHSAVAKELRKGQFDMKQLAG